MSKNLIDKDRTDLFKKNIILGIMASFTVAVICFVCGVSALKYLEGGTGHLVYNTMLVLILITFVIDWFLIVAYKKRAIN